MNIKTLLFALLLILPLSAFSQNETKNADRQAYWAEIKAKKVAFISDKVGLTPEEAQVFWSLYNEYQTKKSEMNIELRKATRESNITDFEKINELKINTTTQEAELQKEYYLEFKKILSAEKIHKLYQAEEDFKKELLKTVQQNRK